MIDPKEHIDWLSCYVNMNFESAIVHKINFDLGQFIGDFRK